MSPSAASTTAGEGSWRGEAVNASRPSTVPKGADCGLDGAGDSLPLYWRQFRPCSSGQTCVPINRPMRRRLMCRLRCVSVLIPARNEERSIQAAVEAALASVGVELEVVVLDDHSEDATAAIVRRTRRPRQPGTAAPRPGPAGRLVRQTARLLGAGANRLARAAPVHGRRRSPRLRRAGADGGLPGTDRR